MSHKLDIENFLQCCCRFITHEERAKEIRDELTDHIYTNIEELEERGLSQEEATNRALIQMGDPHKLSREYKESISVRSRLTVATLIFSLLVSCVGAEVYEAHLDGGSLIPALIFSGIMVLCYIPYVTSLIHVYQKASRLEDSQSLFYIQVCKGGNIDSWILRGIRYFLIICVLIMIGASIADSLATVENDLVSQLLSNVSSTTIWIVLYSTAITILDGNNKKPSVVYEEGLLTFMNFIVWDDMMGYRWQTEHSKGERYYNLQIKSKKRTLKQIFAGEGFMQLRVRVNNDQINLIDEVMKSHEVKYLRYM